MSTIGIERDTSNPDLNLLIKIGEGNYKRTSNDDSVIYRTQERYITPSHKSVGNYKIEPRKLDLDTMTQHTKWTHYDKITTVGSSMTPNNLARSVNKTAFTGRLKIDDENSIEIIDDMLLRTTMNQLEATETQNNYLSRQKKFVK